MESQQVTDGASLLQQLAPHLLEILATLLAAGLAWLSVALKKYIDAKASNQVANGALTFVSALAFDVVRGLEQAVVRELKTALADGKIDRAEYEIGLARVRDQAVAVVVEAAKTHFGASAAKALPAIVAHAEHAVESAVHAIPKAPTTSSSTGPTMP